MAVTLEAIRNVDGDSIKEYDFKGLSTDTKPSTWQGNEVEVNSLFLELDTGDFYYLKSQGSTSTVRETLIEEQSFTGEIGGDNYYYYTLGEIEVSANVIQVVFDGVTYSCERRGAGNSYEYGGTYDEETQSYDLSQYPFILASYEDDGMWYTEIMVADGNEHTIEVYTEETVTVDPVWEKVGSGGSEPSGDGYEINNPVLTVTVEQASTLESPLTRFFVDNDGYLSYETITPTPDSNVYTSIVFMGDIDEAYVYRFSEDPTQVSNEVNCTFNSGERTVIITDPTKDASITVQWSLG